MWQAHQNDLHTLHLQRAQWNHSVTIQSEIGTKFEIHFEIYMQVETFV